MADDKKSLTPIAKFFIYLGAILGAIILVAIIIIAVMFFKPGVSVLGYQFVKYNSNKEYSYTESTAVSLTGVNAIEIDTEITDINIWPNAQDDELKIVYKCGITGLTKTLDADLKVSTQIISKNFEESTTEFKTLIFNIDEPSGWIISNNSAVIVYMPSSITIQTIYARSKGGMLFYNSKSTKFDNTNLVTCNNLYLKTSGLGNVTLNNDQPIKNYYIATEYGSVLFKDITNPLEADLFKFTTTTGSLEYANKANTAEVILTDKLIIDSPIQFGIGPKIRVSKLSANLQINTYNGYYFFNSIGDEENSKLAAITTNTSNIVIGTVYGQLSILSDGNNISNTISVDTINGGAQVNNFEAGSGNIYVKSLIGNGSFNTTTGSIKVDNATSSSSVWAHSTSGNIDVSYEASTTANSSCVTTILTNTGNVNIKNISNKFNVQVLSPSADVNLKLSFTAIAKTENILKSNNRNAVLTLLGTSIDLRHRVVSTSEVTLPQASTGVPGSPIVSGESDYMLNQLAYKDYSYNYRIGYAKDDIPSLSSIGNILVTSTGNTVIDCIIVPE